MTLPYEKEDRKFKKPSSISDTLKCSICMEVFHIPSRLFCGHTFCSDCLEGCLKSNKNCPICRQRAEPKKMGRDLLAYNIINDLEVFCVNEQCSWEGVLSLLELHMKFECLCHNIDHEKKAVRPVFLEQKPVDEEVQEKINENKGRGNLLSRVLMKEDSIKHSRSFEIGMNILRSESMTNSREPTQRDINKPQLEQKNNKFQSFDFLENLYESK